MVLRRARRFFDAQEAEEVVHEVFLRVVEKAHTFRGQASPSTWLYQMTTNHCLNRIRNRRRRESARLIRGEQPWDLPAPAATGETTAFLEQLWSQLDEELMTVGVYHFVDGLTHQEIARILGVSRRTVGNRIAALQEKAREVAS